jgi:acyl dehydratase
MKVSSLGTTKISNIPNIKFLLFKAALKKSSYDPHKCLQITLPNNQFYLDNLVLDDARCKLYHQVIGWDTESNFVHPCYLHTLAFPLHMKLLLLPDFPFPLLGLVHIDNQVRQFRPIKVGEKLSVISCFGQLELHPKGWAFSIKVEFYSGAELVWQSVSTNLFRFKHGHSIKSTAKYSIDSFTHPKISTWQLSTNLGRRYAKASGDFNPIHLSKWSAKLFGFKRHIIHGMWTKSYCVSELQKTNPSLFLHAFEINTTFRQPLYLPSQVNLAVQPIGPNNIHDGLQFKVMGFALNKLQPLHLIGNIRTI